jgi:hypothetical protein
MKAYITTANIHRTNVLSCRNSTSPSVSLSANRELSNLARVPVSHSTSQGKMDL